MLEVKPFSVRDRHFLALRDRDALPDPETAAEAAAILAAVRRDGPAALRRPAAGPGLPPPLEVRVPAAEIAASRDMVSEQFLTALSLARVNLRKFHEYQRHYGYLHDDGDGVKISRIIRPLARVGICCGHSFSTLLLHVVPAQLAGVGAIVAAAAPRADGSIDPRVLATARVLGVDELYRLDGAQAVAALAYGGDGMAPVDKIFGTGDGRAAAAKRLLPRRVAVDGDNGLAEMVVVADDSANARFIAADLVAEAEPDAGGLAVLLTTDRLLAEAVRIETDRILDGLPEPDRRRRALARSGAIYVCSDLETALAAANDLAPARLALMTRDDHHYAGCIDNAGVVLLGPWSAGAAGDFFAGANCLSPVAGAARSASGLGVRDFYKETTLLEYSPDRLLKTGRHMTVLAEAEAGVDRSGPLRERLELLRLTEE
ncbi:MAG: histidinol dehydrogenase [Planctomycetes bacterium]|nr:histidinol dehydrogenase [Planctomycetota bacterium]